MTEDRTRKPVPIGAPLGRLLDITRDAGLPALLVGRHGIGKSEFLTAWARSRGITPYVLDLSLLEATDLTGMPFVADGATRFAPPATLPPSNATTPTALVLEELNRCDRSVRQPCLQLLTTRRLNEYALPRDCFLAACVNPPDTGYDVDELDEALASRFATFPVEPDRAAWCAWARASDLPPFLVAFIEKHRQAFDSNPPRTWTFAGRLAAAALARGANGDELEQALRTVLGPISTQALLMHLRESGEVPPDARDVVGDPRAHVATVRRLTETRRLDLVKALFDAIAEHVASDEGRAALGAGDRRARLREVLAAGPPDLARAAEERLAESER